ncbi:MAG: hypothetical protein ACKV19_08980 [Verrucomicrobiales bacterium]
MKPDPMPDSLSANEIQLTRWIDDVPGAAPPEDLDPGESAQLRAEAEAVAALLRSHVPSSVDPPYPDFFNSQILKKIREVEQPGTATRESPSFWTMLGTWWRSPWLASAATAVLVAAAILWRPASSGGMADGTRVLSVFSPEPQATARVIATRDHSAVIISVDGLEPFPDDRVVVGLLNDESPSLLAIHQP